MITIEHLQNPGQLLGWFVAIVAVLVTLMVVAALGLRKAVKSEVGSYGMFGVVGRMGSGKTYLQAKMAHDAVHGRYKLKCDRCQREAQAGNTEPCTHVVNGSRPVYANFRVDGALPLTSWDDVLAVPHGSYRDGTTGALVLLDEAQLWWPSSAWQAPPDVKAWCAQLRKRRITMVWSSQHQTHVAKRLLQLTFGVWTARIVAGTHIYTCFAPDDVGKANAKHTARLKFRRSKDVMASYDTEEVVVPACTWENQGKQAASGERVRDEHRAGMAVASFSGTPLNGRQISSS